MTVPSGRAGWLRLLLIVLLTMGFGYACSKAVSVVPDAPEPLAARPTVSYWKEVQPIFDDKCAACHACNDAPCQLKLSSGDGLTRGATKIQVYDGARLKDIAPTRLGIDALTAEAWRDKGFYSVQFSTQADERPPLSASLLYSMVELGHRNPWAPNVRVPAELKFGTDRPNQCPVLGEFDQYAKDRPQQGMPYAASGLSEAQFQTIKTWVEEGSRVDAAPKAPSDDELQQIVVWESYLNRDGAREQLVARYLYEHLFLAHLYFADQRKPQFYELLRSSTPPGEPLVPIATVRPNDPAGTRFYYRFRLITDTLVNKTHIIYALDAARMRRYNALFFSSDWAAGTLPGYEEADRANPFATFAAIPAKARYQFMLDNAEYFVRSFIRGPVCSGQIATDVIRDQFWTFFENPETERYVNDAAFRAKATPLIGVPGQDSDLMSAGPEWEKYRIERNRYVKLRQAAYAKARPHGPGLGDVWDGDGRNHDAALTIFRHFNNAAVTRGFIGKLPETIWWMDYPLLERSYYQLVVNFNVFGSVSHQLKTRLYFDLIRNESEYNFLRLLPPAARAPMRDQWYAKAGRIKLFTTYAKPDDTIGTQLKFSTDDAKREAAAQLMTRLKPVLGEPDVINRCEQGDCRLAGDSPATQSANRTLRMLAAGTGATTPFIKQLPELIFLRVTVTGGESLMYSLIHNRAHANVAFMSGEDQRLLPDQDTLTIAEGPLGSYPNFIFDVPLAEMQAFAIQLSTADSEDGFEAVAAKWGVRRTAPQFWAVFHDFTDIERRRAPLEASLFDMNRYENW